MNWINLTEDQQLEAIREESNNRPVVIFKHSTRCSISTMAKSRLERSNQPEHIDFYYLDLIKYRPLSNKIAEDFQVHHESPQVLLIKNGECIYEESHNGITMDEIAQMAAN
ncbi:bacillithiol system redox-active protein YtxJ [Taibaiella soli]|uniref:Bacillithiol system redox-active protein YtxJ n=1 Tax=Taibaiella soli TaxID=1649169 RepID=A0A2W2ADW0_9BACT|nr:bacillithiol system redox-active protein YtxJ [Taibaiella soli]PZF73461.1 bacillithiol system redox-active protein YtxJ [Taibaiella soli]